MWNSTTGVTLHSKALQNDRGDFASPYRKSKATSSSVIKIYLFPTTNHHIDM